MSADFDTAGFVRRVIAMVGRIPPGRVATYGQIATLIGSPRHARMVGRTLAGLTRERAEEVPWHRVINAQGRISAQDDAHRGRIQRALLEQEGVEFGLHGRCSLRRFGWRPEAAADAADDDD